MGSGVGLEGTSGPRMGPINRGKPQYRTSLKCSRTSVQNFGPVHLSLSVTIRSNCWVIFTMSRISTLSKFEQWSQHQHRMSQYSACRMSTTPAHRTSLTTVCTVPRQSCSGHPLLIAVFSSFQQSPTLFLSESSSAVKKTKKNLKINFLRLFFLSSHDLPEIELD